MLGQLASSLAHELSQPLGAILRNVEAAEMLLADAEPIYETLPGWRGNITACRRFDELPKEAQQYVKRLETLVGAPIRIVSVGPERSATIMR